jgi:hypothetical protein
MPWLFAGAGTSLAAWRRRMAKLADMFVRRSSWCAFCSLIAWQLFVASEDSLSRRNSTYHAAQELKPYLKPGIPF